jgi:tetratricopeptide (TPR) repeat protein
MGRINWIERLNWGEEEIEDLRMTGFSYLRQGKYDVAVSFFEALVALNPDDAYDTQTLGALYLQLDDPEKALKMFEKALKSDGEHAPTLLNMTKALLMLGKKEEALRLATILQNEPALGISNTAKALLLAYS